MTIFCTTNLDLRNERWPNDMPSVPNVGDEIVSRTRHNGGLFQLRLQVCRVTWNYYDMGGWMPTIELHMTEFQKGLTTSDDSGTKGSIRAFYEWYAPLVGCNVSNFI